MVAKLHKFFHLTDEHPECTPKRPVLLIDTRWGRDKVIYPWAHHGCKEALCYGPTGADMVTRMLVCSVSPMRRDLAVRYLELGGKKWRGLDHYMSRIRAYVPIEVTRKLSAQAYVTGVSRDDYITYLLVKGMETMEELMDNERYYGWRKPPRRAKEPCHAPTETERRVKALCLDFE